MKKTLIALLLGISFSAQASLVSDAVDGIGLATKKATNAVSEATVEAKNAIAEGLQDVKQSAEEAKQSLSNKVQEMKQEEKEAELKNIKAQLAEMKIPMDQVSINDTRLNGLKEIALDSGEKLYMNTDASMLIAGKMLDIDNKQIVEPAFKKLESFAPQMIIQKAQNEKFVVTAFVDITCHYCQLLQRDAQKYNDLGITLRFLAFPREGLNSTTAKQMEYIFSLPTNEERVKAYNDADNGKLPTAEQLREPNIVKAQFNYGQEYGIQGTPALITQTGRLIPGYLKPEQLLEALTQE